MLINLNNLSVISLLATVHTQESFFSYHNHVIFYVINFGVRYLSGEKERKIDFAKLVL